MKAFIVDDEPPAARTIEALLQLHGNEFDIDEIHLSNNAVEAIGLIDKAQPDVLFLDVEMPDCNGFDLLERINYSNMALVFVTAYRHYAVEAFRANALHYLVKPISPKAFLECLHRVRENYKSQEPKTQRISDVIQQYKEPTIALKTSNGYEVIKCKEIVAVKSEGSYSVFQFENGKTLIQSKNLKHSAEALPAKLFKRISRSAIINTEKVASFSFQDGGSITLNNGEELLIGKTFHTDIANFLKKRYLL